MATKNRNDARRGEYEAEGTLNYVLALFGDELAQRRGWKEMEGIKAIRYYLMQKHHWLPAQVMAISYDDLRFAMSEEMQGWRAPKGAV